MPVSRGMSVVAGNEAGRKNSLNDNNPHAFVLKVRDTWRGQVLALISTTNYTLIMNRGIDEDCVFVSMCYCVWRKKDKGECLFWFSVDVWEIESLRLICPVLVFVMMELSGLGGGFWVAALSCSVVVNHLLIRTAVEEGRETHSHSPM